MSKPSLLLVIFILLGIGSVAQEQELCESAHAAFVKEQNELFANPEESPLTEEEVKEFKTVNYFPYDIDYCVESRWVRTPEAKPFEMPTSSERRPMYVKYGEVHFLINDIDLTLSVYQSMDLIEVEGYEDYLFIPFNDLTNGAESYGGGRYMDMRIPLGDHVVLDLNNSYHPYCAYNHRYSCPIPPDENMLDIEIKAGVRLGVNGMAPIEKH